MIDLGWRAVLGACAITLAAGPVCAGSYGEPVPQGPPLVHSDKGFAPQRSAPPVAAMQDDAPEAQAEAQFVDGDPYGRTDYWQDGRGNRRGTQFGPGYYQKGFYYPGDRQFPDYADYDKHRMGPGSLWTTLYLGAVDPFIPDQREIDFVRAAPVRIITKLRLDEDFRRLQALARDRNDSWAGGRYDNPRPMK